MTSRSTVATALVVVACVLAPLAVSAVWVHRTVYDTDGYVAAVAPLADDTAIQNAIITRVATAIDRELDGVPGSTVLHGSVERAATVAVESEQFSRLWRRLNHDGHVEALTWFSGDSSRVSAGVDGDQLVVRLNPLVGDVAQRIDGVGVGGFRLSGDRIRQLDPKIVLVGGPLVGPIQTLLRTLDDLVLVLPLLALAAAIGLMVAAVDRRRALARLGIGLLITMTVALVTVRLGRSAFIDWINTMSVSVPASTAFFDTLVRRLRGALLIGLVLGFGLALAARFAGAGGATVAEPPDSIATFIAVHVGGASVVVVLLGLGVLALIPTPTLVTALAVALATLAAIAGLWVAAARAQPSAR